MLMATTKEVRASKVTVLAPGDPPDQQPRDCGQDAGRTKGEKEQRRKSLGRHVCQGKHAAAVSDSRRHREQALLANGGCKTACARGTAEAAPAFTAATG